VFGKNTRTTTAGTHVGEFYGSKKYKPGKQNKQPSSTLTNLINASTLHFLLGTWNFAPIVLAPRKLAPCKLLPDKSLAPKSVPAMLAHLGGGREDWYLSTTPLPFFSPQVTIPQYSFFQTGHS